VAVIVVYASRYTRAYDTARRGGNSRNGLAIRPTGAATHEESKDKNRNPKSLFVHNVRPSIKLRLRTRSRSFYLISQIMKSGKPYFWDATFLTELSNRACGQ
jgi:hypothetical protein